MQQLHRTTLWRRAKKKGQKTSYQCGRRPVGKYHSQRAVWLVGESALRLQIYCGVNPLQVANLVDTAGIRPILFALAVWDICGNGETRKRKQSCDFWLMSANSKGFRDGVKSAARKLHDRYRDLTLYELENLISDAARNGEGWLPVALGVDRQSTVGGGAATASCPAKNLETSRRMVSYWRAHKEYPEALAFVRGLIGR